MAVVNTEITSTDYINLIENTIDKIYDRIVNSDVNKSKFVPFTYWTVGRTNVYHIQNHIAHASQSYGYQYMNDLTTYTQLKDIRDVYPTIQNNVQVTRDTVRSQLLKYLEQYTLIIIEDDNTLRIPDRHLPVNIRTFMGLFDAISTFISVKCKFLYAYYPVSTYTFAGVSSGFNNWSGNGSHYAEPSYAGRSGYAYDYNEVTIPAPGYIAPEFIDRDVTLNDMKLTLSNIITSLYQDAPDMCITKATSSSSSSSSSSSCSSSCSSSSCSSSSSSSIFVAYFNLEGGVLL